MVAVLTFGRIVVAQTDSYPVVDTGQSTRFDSRGTDTGRPSKGAAHYGQDAQHDGSLPAYTNNGNGTITFETSPDQPGVFFLNGQPIK